MTTLEAVEWLKPLTRKFRPRLNKGEREAVKLDIEALKRVQREKALATTPRFWQLPGETP